MYMGMTSYNIMGQYGLQTKSGEEKTSNKTISKRQSCKRNTRTRLAREHRQSQKKEEVAAEGKLMPKKGEAIKETWQ